jgi:hypothetical protein
MRISAFILLAAIFPTWPGCGNSGTPPGPGPGPEPHPATKATWLTQGWTPQQSAWFYHMANQGSHLVPYDWFLALEQDGNEKPFRDDGHITKLGYITDPPGDQNADGLPVGFVKDTVPDKNQQIWLGLSCAACHTCQIEYKGTAYRIDGGPGQGDPQTMLKELTAALQKTHDDDAKFGRFAEKVLKAKSSDNAERTKLRDDLGKFAAFRSDFDKRNASTHPFGLARVDAFGIILNEVLQNALGVPENNRPPDAPVSYPFLWDTPQHDFVQWNGIAPNRPLGTHVIGPLSRNVGEVLGVFGELEVPPAGNDLDGFPSSARRLNIILIEELLKKLNSPRWPNAFPPIDQNLAAAGKEIYQANCASCHAVLTDTTAPGRQIQAVLTPISEVGTDPKMAEDFASRRASPGPLVGRKRLLIIGTPFGKDEPAGEVLVHATAGVIIHRPLDKFGPAEIIEFAKVLGGDELLNIAEANIDEVRSALSADPNAIAEKILKPIEQLYQQPRSDKAPAYKARPLNGIWATAPYLHNGSVPNLTQLLLPPSQRQDRFYVGCREFDPVNVGFVSDRPFPGAFEFRVKDEGGKPIPGNSNAGHDYGTNLTSDERRQLLEYLKGL